MKILVTGSNGLLGQKLVALLSAKSGVQLVATGLGVNRNPEGNYVYRGMDITSEKSVDLVISKEKPDVVINTAAMTQVDQCESEREKCWQINVTAVQNLIRATKYVNGFLLHLSTDFIFDGKNGPYREEDKPNPLSYYAESKLASEELLRKSNVEWAVVRTILVYGVAHDMSRSNIVLWVKESLSKAKNIRVVNDQWRTPTLAEDLAIGCYLIAEKRKTGIYHISGKDLLTPYEIAINTANFFGLNASLIEEVDGSVFTQPARRPAKTGFILDKATSELGYAPRSFGEGLAVVAQQLPSVPNPE